MSTQPTAWRSTGLHWESGQPTLTAIDTALLSEVPNRTGSLNCFREPEYRRVIEPGFRIAWRLIAPRQCIGNWNGTSRVPCPSGSAVPEDGTDAQCLACARADRGRQLARDAILGDDGRTYALYLAWFGPTLLKVGLTAADRGRDRLLEQGAITYTLLATGPYTTVRRAEHLISRAGLARERISGNQKIAAWWELPPQSERETAIRTAYDHLHSRVQWPEGLALTSCAPVDQVDDFALNQPPDNFGLATKVQAEAEIVGDVTGIVARQILIDGQTGPLLVDMRRIAGWLLGPAHGNEPTGIEIEPRTRPGDDHDDQPALF